MVSISIFMNSVANVGASKKADYEKVPAVLSDV